MMVNPDSIASLVLQQFDSLAPKRKPLLRDNGMHEWVPLSGVVAQGRDSKLQCLSLATGMKCLPHAKLPLAQGNVLHDWHAEILAIRAFNRFVLDECKALALDTSKSSDFIRRRHEAECMMTTSGSGVATAWHGQPFAWKEDVKLYMYCSEAPCGDASMELTMANQTDASPWEIPPSLSPPPSDSDTDSPELAGPLPGRAYFSHLSLVRRKPARGDAPPTLSKSCSDKLSLAQCTSLLSSLTSLLVSPQSVYIHTLVLPSAHYSASGCARAFSAEGRMSRLAGREWPGSGYSFRPFEVATMELEFAYSKRSVAARAAEAGAGTAASNMAVAWTGHGMEETTLGGVLQGRKVFDPRGASFVSRRKMWALALEVAGMLGVGVLEVTKMLSSQTYDDVKKSRLLETRRIVKRDATAEALKGWVRNKGDDNFGL